MPRRRNKENQGLPARWKFEHGAYFFRVPPGLESAWDNKRKFRLGASLPEAYRVWAERLGTIDDAKTIGQLLDRYMLQVVPTKKKTTQNHNTSAVKQVRAVFADMRLVDLRPLHIYQYVDRRGGTTGSHREIEILSHAFTKAVEWGYIDRHPFKGEVLLKGEKPRTRYVEDWEIEECLALKSKRKVGSVLAAQAYIRLKIMTGMRLGDMLRLTMSDLREDGIYVQPGKTEHTTGKAIIITWTDELRQVVAQAKTARPRQLSPFLFCNMKGNGYFNEQTGRAGGWESLWRGFMDRVLAETNVKERFTEHDLRAKCASDAKTLEHAQALMAHANSGITKRVYRRKAERVEPLK